MEISFRIFFSNFSLTLNVALVDVHDVCTGNSWLIFPLKVTHLAIFTEIIA